MLKQIVVIESDPDILFVSSSILLMRGYLVVELRQYSSCEEIAALNPDLIIYGTAPYNREDEMNCKRLKAFPGTAKCPIILLSKNAQCEDPVQYYNADSCLPQFFKLADLLTEVANFLFPE